MTKIKDKASKFGDELRKWVGDSPVKATVFAGVCILAGYVAGKVI